MLVDATSGAVATAKALPWYLRLLEASRPLHFGGLRRPTPEAHLAAFDVLLILVLGSGLYLWRAKWN